jgi:hypothetical protein
MGTHKGFRVELFGMCHDWVGEIDGSLSLTINVTVDDLHVIDEVSFEVFVFE